jgi:acylphosphatase
MTGQVEVRALGTREQLGKLEAVLWKGPRLSGVTSVEITEISDEIDLGSGFEISD